MIKKLIKLFVACIFALTGLIIMENLLPQIPTFFGYDIYKNGFFGIAAAKIVSGVVGIFIFGGIGWLLAPYLMHLTLRYSERVAAVMDKAPTSDIMIMIFGIGIGLILANLLGAPFARLPIVGPYIPLVLSLIFSVIGAKVALRKHKDLAGYFYKFSNVRAARKEAKNAKGEIIPDRSYIKNKLLDTSVIIDGRIGDIQKTGFLEGKLIVPHFVLDELQRLSDSSDDLKRAKGRRGLDLVHELQDNSDLVQVDDTDFEDIPAVDSKLVKLAQLEDAIIVTNDFNLNKVASIQGVGVLNINDLANAVKPIVVPGEEMEVTLVKEGKSNGQAVAYLDDGTMIVVEGGRQLLGEKVPVAVTSILQTSAGRMIFAKVSK
jgi:uncharacterized protein YacL